MLDLECWQAAAVALDVYACKDAKGRDKRDPVYLEVVERRDGILIPYKKYSSCADRAHWRLWRLGVRAPFVNREERTPLPNDWHVGMNIAQLHGRGAPCMRDEKGYAIRPPATWLPEPGDELLIWNTGLGGDAHSLSIISFDPATGETWTANYGATGMTDVTFPGAKLGKNSLRLTPENGWMYGSKKVQRVTKLAQVVPLITAKPNLDGPEFNATFTGEVVDRLRSLVP